LTNECFSSLTLNISNELERQFCLGTRNATDLTSSNMTITGTAVVFFQDEVMLNKFINETETSIQFRLSDPAGNYHDWYLPSVKYTTSTLTVNDAGVLPISFDFTAVYDDTEGSAVVVTRSV